MNGYTSRDNMIRTESSLGACVEATRNEAPLLGYIETQRAMLNELHYAISELEKRMYYVLEPSNEACATDEKAVNNYLPAQLGELINITQSARARINSIHGRLLV